MRENDVCVMTREVLFHMRNRIFFQLGTINTWVSDLCVMPNSHRIQVRRLKGGVRPSGLRV